MIIYPAIDIKDGKCVRLTKGDFDTAVIYENEPWKAARQWEEAGAEWIHVVDLDGAAQGAPQNVSAIREIIKTVNVPVQFGGGVRSAQTAEMLFQIGVSRVVLGTTAVQNQLVAKTMFENFGDKIAVGIDTRNDKVSVMGWQVDSDFTLFDFAKMMVDAGAKRLIYTDISRDGTLEGVPVENMEKLLDLVDVPVIASGGVATIDDVHLLKPLEAKGLDGVIIGKALYTGKVDLKEAIRVAR